MTVANWRQWSQKTRQSIRVRTTQWRQRLILTIRWWFRLPIDDIKDNRLQVMQAQINDLLELNQKQVDAARTTVAMVGRMKARLELYERSIPRMRDLRRQFDQEQARLKVGSNGDAKANQERLDHGIVGAISS